jgi:L-alanine-DL-glutamate epimerase-like enolase superfamily enzyme
LKAGFKHFKIKIGENVEKDIERLTIIREEIGSENILMVDSNQCFSTNEAIEYMKQLKKFNIYFIEEPTAPDDIIGHQKIKNELSKLNIKVATGEVCANRIMFKQFLQTNAIDICQVTLKYKICILKYILFKLIYDCIIV